MRTPGDELTIPPSIVAALHRAAVNRGILGGRGDALLARLEGFASDLLVDGKNFFGAVFRSPPKGDAHFKDLRSIGFAYNFQAILEEERRFGGSYYTPVPVIDSILELVWQKIFSDDGIASGTLCDPAMGSGFFFLRIVEKMMAERKSIPGIRAFAAHSLYGVDSNPGAVFLTRALLWLALSDAKAEFLPPPEHFRMGDSLLGPAFGETTNRSDGLGIDWSAAFPEVVERGGFSVIVGNPPYEVLTNFARHPARKALAEALRTSGYYDLALSGQINLYRCFIERALALLAPGGELSMVVPLSLARDGAAARLRKHLLERCAARDWLLFGENERIFAGVTQSACVFRAVKNGGGTDSVRFRRNSTVDEMALDELARYTGGTFAIPDIEETETALWKWLWDNCPGRLDDAAEMRVGEVDQTVYRDCMRDIDTGCLLARGAHLRAFSLDESREPGKERFLDAAAFLARKGTSSEAYRRRADRRRVVQLGIRNMQTKPRLVAAIASAGTYIGNSLNVYEPKNGLAPEYLAGVLNSALLDLLFRAGSGNNNINIEEMRRLPFPSRPSADRERAVVSAYRECAARAAAGADTRAARAALDRAVAGCYGVPEELLPAGINEL